MESPLNTMRNKSSKKCAKKRQTTFILKGYFYNLFCKKLQTCVKLYRAEDYILNYKKKSLLILRKMCIFYEISQ